MSKETIIVRTPELYYLLKTFTNSKVIDFLEFEYETEFSQKPEDWLWKITFETFKLSPIGILISGCLWYSLDINDSKYNEFVDNLLKSKSKKFMLKYDGESDSKTVDSNELIYNFAL